MPRPLSWLWRRLRANGLRKFVRDLRNPARLATTIVVLAAMAFVGLSFVWSSKAGDVAGLEAPRMLALFLCVLLVTSVFGGFSERGITFKPAEVDFLFAGPFRRRDLILYHLGTVYPGSWFVIVLPFLLYGTRLTNPVAGLVGILLFDLFAQNLRILAALGATQLSDKVFARLKRPVHVLLLVAFLLFVSLAVPSMADAGGLRNAIARAVESPVARVLFYPAFAAADAGAAPSLVAAAVPLLGGFAAFGVTLALVLLLEVNFLEASIGTSQRAAARRAKAKGGRGLLAAASERKPSRANVPFSAAFRGAGAVLWKNLTVARRSGRALIFSMVFALLFVVPSTMTRGAGETPLWLGALLPLFLGSSMGFDFRGEREHMATLKGLPCGPTALAAAEVFAPSIVALVIQAFLLAVFVGLGQVSASHAALAFAAYVPTTTGMMAATNLAHVLSPKGTILAAVLQLAFLVADAAVTVVLVFLLRPVTGLDLVVVVPVVCGIQVALLTGLLWCVGRAFRRYDVADVPA